MNILVLSDTHVPTRTGQLPSAVLESLQRDPDVILHAGDLVSQQVLQQLRQYGTVKAVAGNMDRGDLKWQLPAELTVTCEGWTIGVTHGHGLGTVEERDAKALNRFPEADIVVLGHTHIGKIVNTRGTFIMNPGSCTDPRSGAPPSVGWIQAESPGLSLTIEQINQD